jgi:hypothetical protein
MTIEVGASLGPYDVVDLIGADHARAELEGRKSVTVVVPHNC